MPQNKKTVGRPKKEFVSKLPQKPHQSWPWRPRKSGKLLTATKQHVSPAIAWFVAKSVDKSKRKDVVILILFLCSFILFIVSLYVTFIKETKVSTVVPSEISEITNIDTGNVEYTAEDIETSTLVQPTIQQVTVQQQTIIDFYQAINTLNMSAMYEITDAYLEKSNIFKTYYNKKRLSNFLDNIISPKIVVTNIEEEQINTTNSDIKKFIYTLEYTRMSTQQKYTEERSTVLIKKDNEWKIGKLMCETKWCSMMPFFNPDKYK